MGREWGWFGGSSKGAWGSNKGVRESKKEQEGARGSVEGHRKRAKRGAAIEKIF